MKVFVNKREGDYSGGMIIVAANTVEEAQAVLLETFPDEINMFEEDGAICFDEAECVTKEHWFYKSRNWTLLPNVISSSPVPVFLAEEGYTE